MEALFYQRYQNLNCKRASVRPSPPPSSAPSLRRVSGFQSESCCVCSAPAPLFLVLKRERIPFLNLRPDAQGWEDLEGGGEEEGNEKMGERERDGVGEGAPGEGGSERKPARAPRHPPPPLEFPGRLLGGLEGRALLWAAGSRRPLDWLFDAFGPIVLLHRRGFHRSSAGG